MRYTDDEIRRALAEHGSQKGAARALGMAHGSLRYRCLAAGIPMPRGRAGRPRRHTITADQARAAIAEHGSLRRAAIAIGCSRQTVLSRSQGKGQVMP